MYAPNTGKRWLWCGMGDTTMTTPASSAATPRRATDHQSPVTSATDFLSSLLLSRTQAHDAEALRLDITLHAPRPSTPGLVRALAGGSGHAPGIDRHDGPGDDLHAHRVRGRSGVPLHLARHLVGPLLTREDEGEDGVDLVPAVILAHC